MRTVRGIPLFWAVDPIRDHAFEVLGDISGLDESEMRGEFSWSGMMV